MKDLFEKINTKIDAFQTDAKLQLEKGNQAAGARARKATLELGKLLKEFARFQ